MLTSCEHSYSYMPHNSISKSVPEKQLERVYPRVSLRASSAEWDSEWWMWSSAKWAAIVPCGKNKRLYREMITRDVLWSQSFSIELTKFSFPCAYASPCTGTCSELAYKYQLAPPVTAPTRRWCLIRKHWQLAKWTIGAHSETLLTFNLDLWLRMVPAVLSTNL